MCNNSASLWRSLTYIPTCDILKIKLLFRILNRVYLVFKQTSRDHGVWNVDDLWKTTIRAFWFEFCFSNVQQSLILRTRYAIYSHCFRHFHKMIKWDNYIITCTKRRACINECRNNIFSTWHIYFVRVRRYRRDNIWAAQISEAARIDKGVRTTHT